MKSLFTDLEKNVGPTKNSTKPHPDENNKQSSSTKKHKFNVMEWIIYMSLLFLICGISAGVGVATFNVAHTPQNVLFQIQFDSATAQLQNSIQTGLIQKYAGSSLLGKMFAYAAKFRYGTTYGQVPPFFTLPGFQDYATDIITLGVFRNINWYPLVDTTDNKTRPAWEAWVKNVKNIEVQTYGQPGNVSTFKTINATAHLYGGMFNLTSHGREKTGDVISGADPRFARWLFPDWQVAPLVNGPAPLFFEPHATIGTRMQTIEKVLAAGYGSRGAFTDIIQTGLDPYPRPSTNYYQAVYSLSPTPRVLGITSFLLSWDTLLKNALPDNLQRVDCVLSTSTTTFTMAVEQGKVTILGKGDFHDPAMTSYGQAVVMDVRQNNPLSASDFTIRVYPSSAFYNQYVTQFPIQLGVGVAVAVFVFLSMMFAVAVLFRQIQKEKEGALRALLEAKKSYVRYISHELRTPLNAATLGLNMVVTQLKKNRNPTPAEAEMCETLCDIRLACSTAVDILNDLLSFEKLESGILVLHRENISVLKFMKEGITLLTPQAKEKGVTLDLVSTVDDWTLKKFPRALPLRANDEFSCDRFKMDQVRP